MVKKTGDPLLNLSNHIWRMKYVLKLIIFTINLKGGLSSHSEIMVWENILFKLHKKIVCCDHLAFRSPIRVICSLVAKYRRPICTVITMVTTLYSHRCIYMTYVHCWYVYIVIMLTISESSLLQILDWKDLVHALSSAHKNNTVFIV